MRKMLLAALLAVLGFAAPARAGIPECLGNITNKYQVVGDTQTADHVYDPQRGYVPNTDGAYLAWLDGNGPCPVSGGTAHSASNSGGLAEIAVDSTASMVTGQRWKLYGTDAAIYDGVWPITVVDATHVTLQGSTWSVNITGGAFWGPQVTPTNAGLMADVNTTNEENFATTNLGYNPPSINSGAHLVLTNPLVENQAYTGTGDAGSPCHMNVDLPQMNLVGSYPIGHPINFSNSNTLNSATACNLRVYASDGTTLKTTVQPGQTSSLVVTSNLTPGGTETTLPPTLSLAYLFGIAVPPGPGAILTTGNGWDLFRLVPGTGVATALGDAVNTNGGFATVGAGNTVAAAQMPALTGDCTTSAGAVATTCKQLNGVDQTTAWPAYTPTATAPGGTPNGTPAGASLTTGGKTTRVRFKLTGFTTCAGCNGPLRLTLPSAVKDNGFMLCEDTVSMYEGIMVAGSSTVNIWTTTGTSPIAAMIANGGAVFCGPITYEAQ